MGELFEFKYNLILICFLDKLIVHVVILLNGLEIVVVLLVDILCIENVTIHLVCHLFNAVAMPDYVELVWLE
jgi:hypothetical protein